MAECRKLGGKLTFEERDLNGSYGPKAEVSFCKELQVPNLGARLATSLTIAMMMPESAALISR